MKTPKTLYILIGVFCVFAIIAGIYAQFIENSSSGNLQSGEDKNHHASAEKSLETIKQEFNNIFTNTIQLNGFDDTKITKIKADEQIIYTAYSIQKKENTYEMNINIPVVNIKNEIGQSFNEITQSIFVNKANEILKSTDATLNTIYSIDYVGYVNGDILSLVIKSTLKEGQNAQRVIVQTYNYNLSTSTKVTLSELVAKKSLSVNEVETKIKKVIKEADDQAKTIQNAGYNVDFSRDLTSSMYTVENSGTFFLGENGKLYIIYAYGNQNFTSEMDVVLFE